MNEPLFTVIIPAYNAEQVLGDAIRSVLSQTVTGFELLVVDDGSTDGTAEVAAACSDPRVRLIRQTNAGAGSARNTGIAAARGEYIAFLDSDDRWLPAKLEADLAVFRRLPSPRAIVYGSYYAVDDEGVILHRSSAYRFHGEAFETIRKRENFLIPSVTTYHRAVFEEVGGFGVTRIHEDHEFVIRATRRFPIYPTGRRLVVYRQTMSGKGRAVLRDFDAAVAAEMSIVDALADTLDAADVRALRRAKIRALMIRFMMYGFFDSARRLAPRVSPLSLVETGKGRLALLSLVCGTNLLMKTRIAIQTCERRLRAAGSRRFCSLYSRGAGKARGRGTVAIVSDHLPGYQLALEHSGSARYLEGFVRHFQQAGYRVVWILMRPRLDRVRLRISDLPYELVGPDIRKVGGAYTVISPVGVLATLAYRLFRTQPRVLTKLAFGVRDYLRGMRGFVHVIGIYPTARDRAGVRKIVDELNPDILMHDGIFNHCDGLTARNQWIVTQDVKYERVESLRARGFAVAPLDFSADREREILEQVGNVVAIQWADAAEFRRVLRSCRIVTVPVTIEAPRILDDRRRSGPRIAFVASGALPNLDGIQWFIAGCWPKIRAIVPDAVLDIYGTVCLRLSNVPEGICLKGVVADIAPAYTESRVVIVPLRMGSGLKVKTVEALAFGAAVVTTSIGAQGLGWVEPRPYLLADDHAGFSLATVRLLMDRDLRSTIAERARRAAGLFSASRAFAELDAALEADSGHQARTFAARPVLETRS